MGETESQNGSCTVERGRSEEGKMVKNGLMWEACLSLVATVTSRLGLLPRAISVSVAL